MQAERREIWQTLRHEAHLRSVAEPVLASYFHANVLNHGSIEAALGCVLAARLASPLLPPMLLSEVLDEALEADPGISDHACRDLHAWRTRDPACDSFLAPFLHFKGFHALQSYRVAHWLWRHGRTWLACMLQSRVSSCFDVDIHPGATIGGGIMIDHGTGIVIGETARVGDDVSMLHGVTLGGSGCAGGQRHPVVGSGVLFGAGARVLGPISVGNGAKIGAGSVVLEDVPSHATAAGVPARIVARSLASQPALDMDQRFNGTEE